ncbi:hypothetical protein GF407_18810 [candidate division KSB1 bacterium]|nr:hypothetical protein [candidate division KSB1 bacterium]
MHIKLSHVMEMIVFIFLTTWVAQHISLKMDSCHAIPKNNYNRQQDSLAFKGVQNELNGEINLAIVIKHALVNNPELQSYRGRLLIKDSEQVQAGLRPNPEFEFELENFGGSGPFNGFTASEYTLAIGQRLELGGKRKKRKTLAALGRDLAVQDYEAARLNLHTKVIKHCLEVSRAQQQKRLREEQVRTARQLVSYIEEHIHSGALSTADRARARVVLATAEIEHYRASQEQYSAKCRLAATWGSETANFTLAPGELQIPNSIPSLESILPLVNQNPDIARQEYERKRAEAVIELEKSKRIPDPVIAAGYRCFNDIDKSALMVKLSLPFPLFNRNQGNLQKAMIQKQQIWLNTRNKRVEINTKIKTLYYDLKAIHKKIRLLEDEILPQAEQAFQITRTSYTKGKLNFIEVSDAQKSWFEYRDGLISARIEYCMIIADMERLIGHNLKIN